MPQHAVKCVERCLRVPDADIQQRVAHTEKHNISTLISTGCTENMMHLHSAAGSNGAEGEGGGKEEMRMTAHTVPVCLGAVLWGFPFVGQIVRVSTLMQRCHLKLINSSIMLKYSRLDFDFHKTQIHQTGCVSFRTCPPAVRWASISVSCPGPPTGPTLASVVAFFFLPRLEGVGITTTWGAPSPSFLSVTEEKKKYTPPGQKERTQQKQF